MHSFQPSRGRIFFEVLCAIGMAASFGGAGMQTGATALLAGALVATLFGLVRFFDLFRGSPAVAEEPQRIDFAPVGEREDCESARPAVVAAPEPRVEVRPAVAARPSEAHNIVSLVEPVEPDPLTEKRRAKAPAKAGAKKSRAAKKAAPVAPVAVEAPAHVEAAFDHDVQAEPAHASEANHAPVAPLFEPEPFVRQQQRSMFGRKAGVRL